MINKVYNNFIEEAETFFISKFLDSDSIKKTYSFFLDVLFNVTKTQDTARGIIAANPRYGQGKSFFFNVVHHRYKRTRGTQIFIKTSAKDLAAIYTTAGKDKDPQKELDRFIQCKNLFIDDIGDEGDQKIFSHYSNKLNVLRYVILKRYEFWIEKGWKLHGTTNLTINEIANEYDGRVADRLKEMTHWVEIDFLNKGSFRQMEGTRRLTQSEIKTNWEKFKTPEVKEVLDLEKYFNDMMQEPDEYFIGIDVSTWSFTKDYFLDKGYITNEDLQKVGESDLIGAEAKLKQSTRQSVGAEKKHSKASFKRDSIRRAINKITRKDIYNAAENIIVKNKFLELRRKKHVFK